MKRFYLAGQTGFGNRGCEALVRSTSKLLKEKFDDVEILVPSFNAAVDQKQWPDYTTYGVRFVDVMDFPIILKIWNRIYKYFPSIKSIWLPKKFKVSKNTRVDLKNIDAVIMIGGDIISLDYDIAPLIWNTGLIEYCLDRHIPVMLWAASTGPFTKDPIIEEYMADFLNRIDAISVRETITKEYLESIGVKKTINLVADPAFVLDLQEFDLSTVLPDSKQDGLLGFNISPLIQKFRDVNESPKVLKSQVASFLRTLVLQEKLSVVLIPHVDSLDGKGEPNNRDSVYMQDILASLSDIRSFISMAPSNLNAGQLKFLISKCDYFIGGRTHATIAALSTHVPTISIAYSVKAKGLNKDLFGHNDYVLETPLVDTDSLFKAYQVLKLNHQNIKELFNNKIPEWKLKSRKSVDILADIIR